MFTYTEKKFAAQIIKAIKAESPYSRSEYVEADSKIVVTSPDKDDKSDITINLNNLFNIIAPLPRNERAQRINEIISEFYNSSEVSIESRLASLRLRARTNEALHIRTLSLNLQQGEEDIQHVIYGEDELIFELVEDSEHSMRSTTNEELEKFNLTRDEAFKMAVAAHARETDANQWEALHSNAWMSGYQDDYDISRLLLSRANTRWPFNEGKVILYAPSHSICLVTNDATAETLNALVKCGDEAASNQRLFSQRFWTLNDGGDWVRYENSEDQEIAKIISLQNYTEDTTNYADQKAIIKKLYEISSTDVFVSDYVAYATEDDRLVSSCTYTLHVPTLLPRTDTVAIYDYENDTVIAMVDWEEFSSLLSDNMQMSNDYIPARYAVLNQIPDEVINQLKQAKSNTR